MKQIHNDLKQWFLKPSGQIVLKQEKALINEAVENLFGYIAVQVGAPSAECLIRKSRINTKLLVTADRDAPSILQERGFQLIRADLDYLPIKKEGVDLVVLPHSLELTNDPYYLLRQVDAMLQPEGHIVITGFNPKGCLMLPYMFSKIGIGGKQYKPFVRMEAVPRVKEWLEVLGYEVVHQHYSEVTCFRQKSNWKGLLLGLEVVEKLLEKLGVSMGNVYCLVVQKKEDKPTLIGSKWSILTWNTVPKGAVVTSARSQKRLRSLGMLKR